MRLYIILFLFGIKAACFAQAPEANLLATWSDPSLPGSVYHDNVYNEIWGFAVNGHEYAVIGSTFGTHIIDVTDPSAIFERKRFQGKASGAQIVHRDYHDYKGYLYAVCDEGNSSLQIIDISGLPDTVSMVYDDNQVISTSHNIFIDTANARLYSFATFSPIPQVTRGVAIFDINNPLNPVHLKSYREFGSIQPSHMHDGYVRDNVAFLNCETKGMAVVDFEDVNNPEILGILSHNNYLQSGYNHSGWPSDDCKFYFMADENWGRAIKTVDLRQIPDLEVPTYFDTESGNANAIPHNQLVACNYLYVSYYHEGLQVYDISNPVFPERVLYYDTSEEPEIQNYRGAWGVFPYLPSGNILVSDMQNGLFVLEGLGDNCQPNANLESCKDQTSALKDYFKENSLTVFPNPSNGSFEIIVPHSGSEGSLEIKNLLGQVIYTQKNLENRLNSNRISINLSSKLAFGTYVVQYTSGTKIFSQLIEIGQ
ncbi:MAG: choice-of-anchor B family protein [Saprospiraceae bacterium]